MREYIIKRLLLAPVTIVGVTLLVFCLTRLVPGGPVERIMQEQAIGALSGEKADAASSSSVSEDERERLAELFNLDEPAWKAYLQWLCLARRRVDITKAEFNDDGFAYPTTSAPDGSPRVLSVRRCGSVPEFRQPTWFAEEDWRIRIESPAERAERSRARNPLTPSSPQKVGNAQRARVILFRYEWDGLLQGNLGKSYKYNEPVLDMMLSRLPVSLYFGILGALLMYLISIPLGIWKALHHRSFADAVTGTLLYVGYAIPGFALGAILLIYLGARLEYFPLYGLTSPDFDSLSILGKLTDLAHHTALPLACYVTGSLALTTMMMKGSLLDQISADYMRTAVAKGANYRRAVWRHALRNAIIPIASGLGGVICSVVGGSILIERVFDIRGFGMLCYQALMDKDYALIMGSLLLSSIVIVLGNLTSDILVASLDPRIKFR